jgi:sugar/nucleoside kinase (ribokinase family)
MTFFLAKVLPLVWAIFTAWATPSWLQPTSRHGTLTSNFFFHHCNHCLQNIFVTLGAGGCCFMSEDANPIVFPSFLKPSKVLSTSGAGDSAFGALIAVYTAMESWKEAAAAGTFFFLFIF